MRAVNGIVANYDAAVTGYPEGSFRNNPGDDTGSGVMAAMGNDLWYALSAMVYKYKGGKSGNAETTVASDFVDAVEAALGSVVSGVSAWDSSTDYSTLGNVSVMRYGVQFTSILSSGNVNKDPVLNPTYWLPCPTARELWMAHSEGRVIHGGCLSLHDHTNANYKQYFSLGKHSLGGANGLEFDAYGVHLDGSGVGSGALSTIIEAWHLKNSFAPGSTGSRTLQDAKGRVMRFIDAAGGRADLIGEVLADQMQGHWHITSFMGSSGGSDRAYTTTAIGVTKSGETSIPHAERATSDGANGTPRTGSVTADKSITVGVPYMVICVPA